jgi:hypothetical protein
MKIASHSILAAASATGEKQFLPVTFLLEEEQQIQQIDGLVGLSPELLRIIQLANELSFSQERSSADFLLANLNRLEQIHNEADPEKAKVVRLTAESYRLATILYVHYRVLGYV